MVFLAVLSGLINLSAQTVFQKVVSMTAGDLYTTYIIVALTFIVGSGIGGFYSYLIRPWLHWVELLTGCYTLGVGLFLSGPFYEYDIPIWAVSAGLILPALALGTHIPLYSYYLRQLRFGILYFLYHFGAVLGLIAFEWYFVQAGSVKGSLFFIGSVQLVLGVLLIRFKRSGNFLVEKPPVSSRPHLWLQLYPRSVISVFFASTLSYYAVFWALRTQTLITDAFRLHATLISSAVFFWMATAGILSKRIRASTEYILLGMGLSFSLIYLGFTFVSTRLTGLYSGSLANYFFVSFILALFLTLPVLLSSLVFISETRTLQVHLQVDVASGGLNLFAGIGNLLGFFLAGSLAVYLWEPLYFLLAAGICYLAFLTLKRLRGVPLLSFSLFALVTLILIFQVDLKKSLFLNLVPRESRSTEQIENVFISSDAFSTIATYDLIADSSEIPVQKMYVVDGHLSHNLESSVEFVVGLIPAMYFKKPPRKSMVIGLGSGQTSWAAAAISQRVELVEIAPSVLRNLKLLRKFNFNLADRDNIEILMKDGFSMMRSCARGSYDLIVNTSTYPSNHGASKLYSDEMNELAEQCLNAEGVYVTYFDGSTVNDLTDFYEFVYPILRHFRYVDILIEPYPIVFATNTFRSLQPLSAGDFLYQDDYSRFTKKFPDVLNTACRTFLRSIPSPAYEPLLNNLDKAYLERNSLRLSIRSKDLNFQFRTFSELYNSLSDIPLYSCE